MSGANTRISNPAPLDYVTPPFPSLYWPYHTPPGGASFLYYSTDIWRFTLIWTCIIYALFHVAVGTWAVLVGLARGKSALKYVWIIPFMYIIAGGIQALLAGSFVGLVLGAVYNAGFFRMSTWIPFVWACINVLVLILSSYSSRYISGFKILNPGCG